MEMISIDVDLSANDITDMSAFIGWRFFSAKEKQYIDGVQLRFTEMKQNGDLASGVPATSPFIHRDTNFFQLASLKADTEYSVDLYLIPVPNSRVELFSSQPVTFRTKAPVEDPFDVVITISSIQVSGNAMVVGFKGVPSPQQQFVSLYRLIYSEYHVNAVDESQIVYKEPKVDQPDTITVGNLKKSTRYQLWLEAYMRNGKIVKSNVLDLSTSDKDEPSLNDGKTIMIVTSSVGDKSQVFVLLQPWPHPIVRPDPRQTMTALSATTTRWWLQPSLLPLPSWP